MNDYKNFIDSQTRLSVTKLLFDVIDKFKELNPDYTLVVESPGNSVRVQLDDCLIYEGREGSLVFDAE